MVFENLKNFFINKANKTDRLPKSKEEAKERLHDVLVQDRVNVSVDFLELMKQEMIDVVKKYIDVDEKQIDVKITNKDNGDGTLGAPTLYANIPILKIKNETKKKSTKKTSDKAVNPTNKTAKKETATTKSSTKKEITTKTTAKKEITTKGAPKKESTKKETTTKVVPKKEATKKVATKK